MTNQAVRHYTVCGVIAASVVYSSLACGQVSDEGKHNAVVATVAPLALYFPILPGENTHFTYPKPPMAAAGEIAYRRRVGSIVDVGLGVEYLHPWAIDFHLVQIAPILRLFAPTSKRLEFGFQIAAGLVVAEFLLNDFSTLVNAPPSPRVLYLGGFIGLAPGISIRVTPTVHVPVGLAGTVGLASKGSVLFVPSVKLSSGVEVRF